MCPAAGSRSNMALSQSELPPPPRQALMIATVRLPRAASSRARPNSGPQKVAFLPPSPCCTANGTKPPPESPWSLGSQALFDPLTFDQKIRVAASPGSSPGSDMASAAPVVPSMFDCPVRMKTSITSVFGLREVVTRAGSAAVVAEPDNATKTTTLTTASNIRSPSWITVPASPPPRGEGKSASSPSASVAGSGASCKAARPPPPVPRQASAGR